MGNNFSRIQRILFIVLPLLFVAVFLYMTFFNSAYESPGRILYYSECASCHGDHGEGIRNLVPPIRSDYFEANFNQLPCMILNGIDDSILVNGIWYNQPMYPIKLSEVELANLMNFLRDTFIESNTENQIINAQWVESKIADCK
jgi:hypothetical protein